MTVISGRTDGEGRQCCLSITGSHQESGRHPKRQWEVAKKMKSTFLVALALVPPVWAEEITFTRDVAPIFLEHCGDCHRDGGIAPMSLTAYASARPWARSIGRQVAARRMPPYHAAPGALQWPTTSRSPTPRSGPSWAGSRPGPRREIRLRCRSCRTTRRAPRRRPTSCGATPRPSPLRPAPISSAPSC